MAKLYDMTLGREGLILIGWALVGERPRPEIGYTFVFIYGLERRAIVDQHDHRVIFDVSPSACARFTKLVRRRVAALTRTLPAFLCLIAAMVPQKITACSNPILYPIHSIPFRRPSCGLIVMVRRGQKIIVGLGQRFAIAKVSSAVPAEHRRYSNCRSIRECL